MWARFKRLGRRTRIAIVAAASLVAAVAMAAGGLIIAERHPEALLRLLGATSHRVFVIAHRGASDEAPENTLAAFRKAREAGADGVECDVVFTRDDVPVIVHDDNLGDHRIRRPGVWIRNLSLAEAQQIDVGSWFSPEFASERIPTLREGLDSLATWTSRVYLHDKETNDYAGPRRSRIEAFARAIRDSGMIDRAVVMVAGENYSLWRELAPDIRALNCWMQDNNVDAVLKLEGYGTAGTTYLGMHVAMLHRFDWAGRQLLSAGLPRAAEVLGLWPGRREIAGLRARPCDFVVFTVNEPYRMLLYAYKGFDAIGTDKPRLLRATLGRREPPGPSRSDARGVMTPRHPTEDLPVAARLADDVPQREPGPSAREVEPAVAERLVRQERVRDRR
ncbi:MAG TPA: glycerophosphodiester phosphodiesterase family protein [Isosphaeraceae bacterium]